MDYKSKVAVYLRKSRMDDASESVDETLEKHRNILTEYAIKHDITITKIYKEVVSGDSLFCRPEMLAMLNDIEQGHYTSVLCIDIDRLGRSSGKDSGIIMETLQENNCKIITPEKIYDLDDDIDEMTVEMKTFFARQELKSIKKRLHRGEVETLKAGGHTGEPPYGYKRIWLGKTPSLAPTEAAETVKMIYNWYVKDGYGGTVISDKLNAMGVPAPDGGRFSRSSITMILQNPIYTGKIVWNRKKRLKKKKPTDKYKEIDNPPEQWLQAEGLHEAIIPEDMWNEAQKIRERRSHPPTYTGILRNPYAGLIYCANCGSAIQRQCNNVRKMERLLCPTTGCNGSIATGIFETRLLNALQTELQNLKLRQQDTVPDTRQSELIKQATLLKQQIRQLNTQRNKLHDLLEQGVYDIETFMSRQENLISRLQITEKEYDETKKRIKDLNNIDHNTIILSMEQLLSEWDNLDAQNKNNFLKDIIEKIIYFRPPALHKRTDFEIQIQWRF